MQKINKRIKVLNTEESESVLGYFKNKDNLIYKNDTESSLKQMMKVLNENDLINGERKLGKEVKVELHHSSILTRVKAGLLLLTSHLMVTNNKTYQKQDSDIEILIYEDNAYRGFINNIKDFFGNFFNLKLLDKNDYLNYVLSHEYGHLKHFEWQTENKLFCPLKDRKSLFMNLITEPEMLKSQNFKRMLPEFMYKKILPGNILDDEKPAREKRNMLSFQETFADIYSFICLKQIYGKETYDKIKETVLKERLKENKLGSPYYTSDAIKEFIDSEPVNLNTKEDITNYVMDISLRNGFKYFVKKYNKELKNWTNIINVFGNVKGKYKEYEKDLFCEIAFLAGGLIPNATNNDLTKNMEILENEFGIHFGFKNNNKYIENIQKSYNFEINLYIMAGKTKNNILYQKIEPPIDIINSHSDKDLIKYINDKMTFLEKSVPLINRDFSISSMFNYELNNIYYVAGFLLQKEEIKNNIEITSVSNKKLLGNIGIDLRRMEDLDEEKQYCNFKENDTFINEDMFFDGKREARKRSIEIKNNLSVSSVLEKLKQTNVEKDRNILNIKKELILIKINYYKLKPAIVDRFFN